MNHLKSLLRIGIFMSIEIVKALRKHVGVINIPLNSNFIYEVKRGLRNTDCGYSIVRLAEAVLLNKRILKYQILSCQRNVKFLQVYCIEKFFKWCIRLRGCSDS